MPYRVEHLYGAEADGENVGQFHHRITSPTALFAGDATFRARALSLYDPAFPARARNCDLLVVHSLSRPEVEAAIRQRRALGRRTVYEIADDFLGIGPWLPPDHVLRSPLVRQHILYLASLCDGLQVSSPGVAARFRTLHANCVVLDNYVPVPAEAPPKPGGFVFGWAGTRSHFEDLAAVAPAIVGFCRDHPEAVFAYMGDRAGFDALFAALPAAQRRFRPFGTYADYMAFLRTLHVGLAPLRPTPFNQGRTDVKFVEYTVCGAAAVLADVDVYRSHAAHACLFDTPAALRAALERLYADPSRRAGLAREALGWVQAHRSASALREQRNRFYLGLLGNAPPLPPARSRRDGDALAARLAGAWEAHAAQRYEDSLACCRDLLQRYPGYRQAHWLLAKNLYALERYDELLACRPGREGGPLYAEMIAELAYKAARRVCPPRAHRYLRYLRSPVTRLRLDPAAGADRAAHFRAILRHQPYDYFALFGLVHLLRRSEPQSPELPALLERARLLAAEAVPPSFHS